jgi:hypothetical protein
MTRIVLFIRVPGASDILDYHTDQASAWAALGAYVQQKTGRDIPADRSSAKPAIDAYFEGDDAFYTIAGIPAERR